MKGSLKRLIAIFMLFLHIVSLADGIVPDIDRSKNLNVDKAINGVPLVNIEAPNNNGISHNVYKDFNVDGRGAILNNSKDLTNSQLGGLIYGNPNLQNSKEASTIINEVSGVNRSRIEGYQEIAGKKANYILANPNGIYINGAGFINTGNVTLTTGSGNDLLNPEKGTIEVAGKGLDLRNINKAELVARVAELSAPIYGGEEVNLKLGSQGQSNKPEYALDARELGSIYAGRINIVVNEDGVGVKTEAPMYAEKGDVVISSKGKVYLKDTQAKGDIKISSTGTEISDKLVAENTINIESKKTKNSGQIQANKDITINGNVDSSNLISTNKDISISRDLKNSGQISAKNLTTNNIDNKGNIITINDINSQSITNNGKLLAGNQITSEDLTNTSVVQGKTLNVKNKINSNGKIITDNISTKDISNSGNISSINIKTQELTNSGEIISNNLSSNNLKNSKELYVNGNLKVESSLNNSGIIEGLELNTKSIENTGNITIKNKLEVQDLNNKKDTANVNAGFLDAQNKISSVGNIKAVSMKTKELDNSGNILAGSLTTIENFNKGNITAKNISNQNLVNDGNIKVSGNLNVDKLTNSKNIIAQDVIVEKFLSNINGKINSSNVKINTSNIKNNNGSIQAVKNIDITTSNDLNLDGKYTANDTLNIRAKSLENNGNLENDGKISLKLTGNLNNNNKITSSGDLNITAKNISNNGSNSVIGSEKNMKVTTDFLKNEGNLLFGEGVTNKLKVAENIINSGVIASLGKIDIDAKNILNDKHIVSDNDLTISTNSITNKGLLYSTGNMKVDFKDNFLNDKADIYSSGDITFTGKDGNFTNKVGNIESEKNIKIEAKDIKNLAEITGNHKVTGSILANESNVDMSKLDIDKYNKLSANIVNEFFKEYIIIPRLKKNGYSITNKNVTVKATEQGGSFSAPKRDEEGFNIYGAWDWEKEKSKAGVYLGSADKIESNYTSESATIKAGKNITLIAKNNVENLESNILANGNVDITANRLINKNFEVAIKRKITLIRDIEYHGSAMHNLEWGKTYDYMGHQIYNHNEDKGNMIIQDEVDSYVGTGKNAKISAGGNINIIANKIGNGLELKENISVVSKNQKVDSTSVAKNNIDLDNKNTNVDQIILNKKNLETKEEIDIKKYIDFPKNDKGLFRINNNIDNKPGFSYLIETNVKFIDKSRFLGSEYFFKRLGFNPNRNVRLLGDAFYETKLVNKAILEGTGRRYLGDYNSDKEQMQALYDNATNEQANLNLSLGIALNKDQIAKLKKDIIWYIEEEVQGQKVLVPKVYLTKNTLSNLKNKNASIEAGKGLTIKADDIQNTGNLSANNITITTDNLTNKTVLGANRASIDGNTINITAKNSVDNIGADISAKDDLIIKAKNISNLSTERINGYGLDTVTTAENLASIKAKNVNLDAENNVKNTGANIKADEKINIKAKNVKIDTIEENRYFHDGDSKNYLTIDNKSNISSNIEAKNINIDAKNDINIKASNIVAKEEANIKADGDINIVSATDSKYYAYKETKKGKFGKSKSEETINFTTRNVASNVIGDKVNITSGKDVNILGSNIQADTEGEINAKGNITQAGVKDVNYSYHKKTKTGFMGLTSKSVTDENYAEKAILSATLAGDKGLTYDSKNNLLLEGVKVVSSGSINLKGKNVEINPLETKAYSKHKEEKKGFSGSLSAKGVSLSYGKDKLSSDTDIVNQTASQIVSNKDINIEATNKVKAKSVDIYAKNDINISGDKGVEISTANNSYDNTTKQSSSRIGVNFGVNPAIVNTVENIKDIKNLTDFSGNSYDILNNTSKVVGAIKDGAKATNDLLNFEYSIDDATGAETLKYKPHIFNASISYNKSESKSSVHNESVEKSSIEAGRNMNIKSKDGNISISGTDVKVGNDLSLTAKKDIDIKAAEEKFTSSSSSSQTGVSLSVNLEEGRLADLSISKAGTKGKGNGTSYVNSTINVGGKLKTNSENLTLSGANVEADKVDIKAKNVVIESKQDKSENKDSTYGGGFSIDLANPSNFSANINGSKGNGEKDWVNKQTSLIAKNGGKIDTENLTNIGAVIGSESETNKLKVSANKVVVKDLEDKNKSENIGGGVSFGTDVPNVSVKHDKVDKEQINRATALNTDFEVAGQKVKAEDLGFNTNKDKAQEVTKDEERHLDADLHTDLIGEDKRNEIKYAYKKLGSLKEILDQKKFKESMEGILVDKFKDEHQKEFNLIKEENLSLEDKQKLAQNLVERYLRENGYEGEIPEVLLTDEAHSFTVDSKDKETGAKRREKIYFSINDIANPDLAFSKLFAHEKAHMNTYDEGKDGEETSIHTREKVGSENKNKVFTEEEKADYLNNLRNKYKDQKSIEQQFAEAKLVPEKDKEHWAVGISINGSATFLGRVNVGRSKYFIYNENSKELTYVKSTDIGIGLGTIGVGASGSIVFLKNVNTIEDLEGHSFVFGGSYTVTPPWSIGLEIIFDSNKKFSGIRIVGGAGKTLKAAPPLDGYFSVDSTIITHNEDMTKFRKEIEKNIEYNLDEISKLAKDPETAIKNSYKLNKISKKLIDDVNRLRK